MDAPTRLTPSPPTAYVDVTNPVVLGWKTATSGQAYELKIVQNTLNASPYWLASNGTLNASQQTPSMSGFTGSATITANQLIAVSSGYQWKVRYLALDGSGWSPWSNYSRLFTSVSPPTATVIEPTSAGTTSNHTKVVFSYSDSSSRSMSAFRIKVYKANTVVYDTGEVYASISSGSSYSYIVDDYTNVKGPSFTVGVLVKNSVGLWSAETQSASFTTNLVGLSNPTIYLTDKKNGVVRLDIDSSSVGKTVLAQDLYRYNPLKREFVLLSSDLPASFIYEDLFAPLNTSYFYRLFITATDGTQQYFTSDSITASGTDWAVANSSKRQTLTVENFSADYQSKAEYIEPLGRTRSVSYRLDNDSREGGLGAYVVSSERAATLSGIYSIIDSNEDAYIISPFGDVVRVRFQSPEISDLAGGDCRLTLKFTEVAAA